MPLRRVRRLWWANPLTFAALVLLPAAILIGVSAGSIIAKNGHNYFAPNYVSPQFLALSVWAVVATMIGAWIGNRGRCAPRSFQFRPGALEFLFWFTALAYLIWFGPALMRSPGLVLGALTGQSGATYALRDANLNVRGVTTMTQFGIAYICVYGISRFLLHQRLPRRHTIYAGVLFALALFRAIVNSERIALLELVFPMVLIYGSSVYSRSNRVVSAVCRHFPVFTILGAPIFFALFEYNRSWINYYQYKFDNLLSFALERLLIYYVTALNNICGLMQVMAWPTYKGELTLEWLYRAPGVSALLAQSGYDKERYTSFLLEYAHPEFNNATGTMIAFHDWGVVGGTLLLVAVGMLTGRAYRNFTLGRGGLMYVYPPLFYALYECLRIGYAYDGRSVAAYIGLGIAALFWGRRRPAHPSQAGWLPAAAAATR